MIARTFPDLAALARAAADDFIALITAAPDAFHVALSGGSTPKALFAELVARQTEVPWDRVHLWWGDERTVPPDQADSNYGMAKEHLLDKLTVAPAAVHRLQGERDPVAAAAAYERLLEPLGAPPMFDLIWLGMGSDGHTASLFPDSAGLDERTHSVIANRVDSPLTGGASTRLTLTLPVLDAARHVRFLVAGADKAAMVANIHAGPDARYPASRVASLDTLWFLDRAAAAALPQEH